MKSKIALLLVTMMVLSAVLMIGCDKADSGEERVLNVGFMEYITDYNPYTSSGSDCAGTIQIYDTLLRPNAQGVYEGHLADTWSVSDDGMAYTFTLRKGVKFTNGEELKSVDIAYSVDQAINSLQTGSSWAFVDSCEIVDDYTVIIHLNTPGMQFTDLVSSPFASIVNKKACEEWGDEYGKKLEAIVGTGAYKVSEWVYGESSTYVANEDHFKGAPPIKSFKLIKIAEQNSAVIALETGEIDAYISDVPAISLDAIEANNKLVLKVYPGATLFYSIINNESGIFADKRMRQALAYSIDRNKMMVVGSEGRGLITDSPCADHFIGHPGQMTGTWNYETDIDKAQALLAEAGYAGEKITIKTYATDAYPKLATSMQEDMAKAGFTVEVLQMERNAFISDVLGKGDYQVGICRFVADVYDMFTMSQHLHSENVGTPGNWSRYVNPDMDSMLERAGASVDLAERKSLYSDIIKLYADEVPEIPFYYTIDTRAHTTVVKLADVFAKTEPDRISNYSWAE